MPGSAIDPMVPVPFRIEKVTRELGDTFTLTLVPEAGGEFAFAPGQFNMLYVFGVGEVPISISGDPTKTGPVVHTVRAVGGVTRALEAMKVGQTVGLRGPFGSPWPVADAYGKDVLIVAGGVGLAPLRPVVHAVLSQREKFGRVVILYGARPPADILFEKELHNWRGRFDVTVEVTVDRAAPGWTGNVGVVTKLIEQTHFDAEDALAFVCGPEVMMRFAVRTLNTRGVDDKDIRVSMERNMKCALGFCGHCQWGRHFVCKDGPVFSFDKVRDLFNVREL